MRLYDFYLIISANMALKTLLPCVAATFACDSHQFALFPKVRPENIFSRKFTPSVTNCFSVTWGEAQRKENIYQDITGIEPQICKSVIKNFTKIATVVGRILRSYFIQNIIFMLILHVKIKKLIILKIKSLIKKQIPMFKMQHLFCLCVVERVLFDVL